MIRLLKIKNPLYFLIDDYIEQLSEKEKIVYEIAKQHLGTSFNIEKSIGYKKWLKNLPL